MVAAVTVTTTDTATKSLFKQINLQDAGFRRPFLFFELLSKRFLSESKDLFDIPANQQPVDQRSAEHRIFYLVATERAAILFLKRVPMNPLPVRPATLLIHEFEGRFPGGNLTLPADRKAPDLQAIVDSGSDIHLNRIGCKHFKF